MKIFKLLIYSLIAFALYFRSCDSIFWLLLILHICSYETEVLSEEEKEKRRIAKEKSNKKAKQKYLKECKNIREFWYGKEQLHLD